MDQKKRKHLEKPEKHGPEGHGKHESEVPLKKLMTNEKGCTIMKPNKKDSGTTPPVKV
ncbi:MAG: hypothetical protein IJL98_09135 [Lachnospiraceae bacterium]|nr:hypothetical protein [Lachnospiraceae bacterium]